MPSTFQFEPFELNFGNRYNSINRVKFSPKSCLFLPWNRAMCVASEKRSAAMKKLMIFVLLAASLTGCVVAPAGPAPHPGAYWVPGHYGASGYWHPGHWA
jgi:hypothetical protein